MPMIKDVNRDMSGYVIVSVKEGKTTDILNSSVFQTNPAVNYGVMSVSVTSVMCGC